MILMLNNNPPLSTKLNSSAIINFTGKNVHDEIRGYLVNINSHWTFIGPAQKKKSFPDTKKKKIILSLESPHKDEFDIYGTPLRPANGRTGLKINLSICNRAFVSSLNIKYIYEVYLMNPIQYQASCYSVLGNNYSRNNTNQVFRKLFSKKGFNLRDDFIIRINTYEPDIIINCCTSNLKRVVKKAIFQSNFHKNYYEDKHPSVW